jgi:hypothetical protein
VIIPEKQTIHLYPDAGPLITLAYSDALDLLFVPGWQLVLVDMIYAEVTRSQTPTSEKIRRWAQAGFSKAVLADTADKSGRTGDTADKSRRTGDTADKSRRTGDTADKSRRTGDTADKSRRTGDTADKSINSFNTRIHAQYAQNLALADATSRQKNNLGEFAIQEAMNECALQDATQTSVFLFEDHKIARASFLLPENARKVSTRAFLQFLEALGRIESPAAIERRAVSAGRTFSQIHFP